MRNAKRSVAPIAALIWLAAGSPASRAASDFAPLFNGRDLAGWKIPDGDNGHWRVVDGVIDYDAGSEAGGDKSLWRERSFVAARGPLALQHHGEKKNGVWVAPPSLVQFRNIAIKELP